MSDITLGNYVENAIRTESKVDDEFGMNSRVLHALMGLSTETGELIDAIKRHIFYVKDDGTRKPLDSVNLCEEIGDLMWYIAILCDYYGLDFKRNIEIFCQDSLHIVKDINVNRFFGSLVSFQLEVATQFQDCFVCGRVGYSHPSIKNHPNIKNLLIGVNNLVNCVPMSWEEIAVQNIEKLRARFPEKYECSNAYDRDLNKERKILEKPLKNK